MENDEPILIGQQDRDPDDRTRRFFGEHHRHLHEHPVLVVGAGAVGNEVVKNLVMLGVRRIYLVDFDKVSASNLNRCVFFRPDDHDKTLKVDAIVREAKALFPESQVVPFAVAIQEAPEEVWQVPLVIVAVDNNEARYFINLRTLSLDNTPFVINSAMGRTFCEAQVLLPGQTACMVCPWSKAYMEKLFSRMVREDCDAFFHRSVERFPAISVISSILGSIVAAEAVKILVGLESWRNEGQWQEDLVPALGDSIRYDIRDHESSHGRIYRNPQCVEIFCKKKSVS